MRQRLAYKVGKTSWYNASNISSVSSFFPCNTKSNTCDWSLLCFCFAIDLSSLNRPPRLNPKDQKHQNPTIHFSCQLNLYKSHLIYLADGLTMVWIFDICCIHNNYHHVQFPRWFFAHLYITLVLIALKHLFGKQFAVQLNHLSQPLHYVKGSPNQLSSLRYMNQRFVLHW